MPQTNSRSAAIPQARPSLRQPALRLFSLPYSHHPRLTLFLAVLTELGLEQDGTQCFYPCTWASSYPYVPIDSQFQCHTNYPRDSHG